MLIESRDLFRDAEVGGLCVVLSPKLCREDTHLPHSSAPIVSQLYRQKIGWLSCLSGF